jgi:hypothetical protein
MTSKTKRILFGTLAAVAVVVALDSVYLLGYRHGSRDALDWDFSAVVGGKVVRVGSGAALLRSRMVPLKPTQNVNIVSRPFALTNNHP